MSLLEAINEIDKAIIAAVHQWHTPFWDEAMCLITGKYIWFPFYGLVIAYIFYRFRLKGFFVVVSIVALVILSDFIASGICKPLFERLRPCHDPTVNHLLNAPCGCGGKYGFFSSHAANTFSFATSMVVIFRKKQWVWLFVLWAAIVSFTRLYIGVHYTSDLIMGGLTGALWSILYWQLIRNKYPQLIRES